MNRIGSEARLAPGAIDADDARDTPRAPLGERRAYAAPYESLTW